MPERHLQPGSVDALAKAGIAQYLFGQLDLFGHLGPAVGARAGLEHVPQPPKPGIDLTKLRLLPDRLRPYSQGRI